MSTAPPPAAPVPPAASSAVARRAVAIAAAAGLTAALFADNFASLSRLWDLDANYSHGILVGPISLLLAYRVYRRVGPPVRGELGWGLMAIGFGIACQLGVTVFRWPPLGFVALVAVVRGLLVCAGGRAWAAAFNFPLLFLFFMFPVPAKWTSYAALWLQDVVSRVSETVIGLFVVCHRVGHNIRIAGVDQSLVVAEECSGLGQIVSFLAFAALLGHLMARPGWYRAALLVASVPVAVAANTLRVVLMNLGAYWFGTGWMSGKLHDAPALFSIPVGILLFLFCDWVLSKLADPEPKAPPAGAPDSAAAAPPEPKPGPPAPDPTPRSEWPKITRGLAAAVVLLAAGVAAQFALAAHLKAGGELSYAALGGPLASIPPDVTDANGRLLWKGYEHADVAESIRAKLPFQADDLLVRTYAPAGQRFGVQLYMVHSRAGEDRKHHPEICIRDVSGAPEELGFRKKVPLGPDEAGEAQAFKFRPTVGRVTVVYYWHYTLPPTPNPGLTRVQEIHQRVGVTAPSVTVQVTVTTDDKEALKAIEQQLLPGLDAAARRAVLPAGTEAGSHRIPIALAR